MEETINHRVKKLVEIKGNGNVRAFARLADVNHQTTHHVIEGNNKPGFDYLQKLLSTFRDINPDWLLLGDPQMYRGQLTANPRDQVEIDALKTRIETLELLNESLNDKIAEYKVTVENMKSLLDLNTAHNKQQLIKEKRKR